MRQLSCEARDAFFGRHRDEVAVSASLTNYVAGEVLNYELPPVTRAVWSINGVDVLKDELDEFGCRHWLLEDGA